MFGKPFEENWKNGAWIQNVWDPQWHGKIVDLSGDNPSPKKRSIGLSKANKTIVGSNPGGIAFAIIRDPATRVMSAYRSKVACPDQGFTTDPVDRKRLVPQLSRRSGVAYTWRYLQTNPDGQDEYTPCFTKRQYLEALDKVTVKYNFTDILDKHFKSIMSSCFSDFEPSKWTVIRDLPFLSKEKQQLTNALGGDSVPFPHTHRSDKKRKRVQCIDELVADIDTPDGRYAAMLSRITAWDYYNLRKYLRHSECNY